MPGTNVSLLPIGIPKDQALQLVEVLSEVNYKIGRLDEKVKSSQIRESLIQIFSLKESVESTRIEGTQVTFTDMLEEKSERNPRWEIIEISNYQRALQTGYERIKNGYPITSRLIKELHEILMADGRGSTQSSGEFRKVQNFIGPTNDMKDATFIPVSPDRIDAYMENLEFYLNKHPFGEALSTDHIPQDLYVFHENTDSIVKAAIIHAQFESIHPFLDGNGRLGRILIVLSLIQFGIISQPIFFVSEELEKERPRYYDLLNGVRGDRPNWEAWIQFFLKASNRMADKIHQKFVAAEQLAVKGLRKCETESEKNVWLYTFSNPFVTAKEVAEELAITQNTARKALKSLVEKDLLFAETEKKRNKKYRNYDLMRVLRD